MVYNFRSQRCFLLHPPEKQSQSLFAFEWTTPGNTSGGLTWTILSQGFRDHLHLFGQTLSQDLAHLHLNSGGTLIQYVDDLLISSPTKQDSINHTIQTLNFLTEQGYKVSRAKAQLVQQKVTYLGLIPTPRKRGLSPDQVQAISLPQPITHKQLRAFLGLTGYFGL